MSKTEVLAVGWVGLMVTTCLLQTISFITPHWACKKDNSSSTENGSSTADEYCDLEGLFYPDRILDHDVFRLCLICLVGSYLFSAAMVYRFKKIYDKDDFEEIFENKPEIAVSVLFLIVQFLAGVANVLILVRFDFIGWSAVLFFTFAFPVFVVVVLAVATAIIICVSSMSND